MPSGSKKRKAAKKRKENQPSNNPDPSPASPQTHGDGDDVKLQDDKNSDAGEASSSASQDCRSGQNNSSSGEEEIESENVTNPSLEGTEIDVTDKSEKTVVESGFVPIEKESRIENKSDESGNQFEGDEKASKSHYGGPSRSSSSLSSSDDESSEIKNNQSKNVPSIIVSGDAPLPGGKEKIKVSSEANSPKGPSIEEAQIKESEVERPSLGEGEVGILEEEVIIPSVENVGAISDARESLSQESDDRLSLSYNAPDASPGFEKDSGVSEPLLAPAPHAEVPEQRRTTWKSCCGLFEALTASGR